MNGELQRVFDNAPDDEPRSRLEPYRELVLRWRRQGRSYRRICKLLGDQCEVQVGLSTLHEFVRRRSRTRKAQPEAELDTPALPCPETGATQRSGDRYIQLSREQVARQRALIQALREKPPFVPGPPKRFVYDPDEPLIIERTDKE